MENQPGKRRNRVLLPGHRSRTSRDELRNFLSQTASSTSQALPEYIIMEVKPVQESAHSRSTNMMNIPVTEAEADQSHISSPVSEYGHRGRNHYKSSFNIPVSEETCPRQISEERQNEFVCTDGPGDTHKNGDDVESNIRQRPDISPDRVDLQGQQKTSCNQSEKFNLPVTKLLKPQNTDHPEEQDFNNPKECEFERNEEESSTGSFIIPSCELSFADSIKGMLNSSLCQKSVRDSKSHEKLEELFSNIQVKLSIQNQEGSEKWDEILHSVQTKLSVPNQEDNELESIRHMLVSLIGKVCNHDMTDVSIPDLASFILMWSLKTGKNSLGPMTYQLPLRVPPDSEMMAILRADCHEPHCSKSLCPMVQQCLGRLQDIEVPVSDLTCDEQKVLSCMYDHCRICEYPHCPLYWCQKEALNWINDDKEILAEMKQLAEHGYHSNFLDGMKKGTFVKFFQGLPFNAMPREPEEWGGLCRLIGANSTILARFTDKEREEYWIIKKSLMYKSHSQMDLYETLRQISHNGIALHLWAVFCPDIRLMAVCVGLEEFSLYDRLQESPFKNLHVVVRVMHQLIRTTEYLHEKGILYLNWSSKNIVYTTGEHFKLTNFTCSALKSRIDKDIADISLSLPRHLMAPEMLEKEPKADEKTDIWGHGCLLKEILSGQPVWHEYLHEPDNVISEKIMAEFPRKPHDCLELTYTFMACWEKQRSSRPSLQELEMLLIQAKKDKEEYS